MILMFISNLNDSMILSELPDLLMLISLLLGSYCGARPFSQEPPSHFSVDASRGKPLDQTHSDGIFSFALRRESKPNALALQVKNKAPAEVQITAEQLLREAKERELELLPPPPQQKITDVEELNDYKLRKRKVKGKKKQVLPFYKVLKSDIF